MYMFSYSCLINKTVISLNIKLVLRSKMENYPLKTVFRSLTLVKFALKPLFINLYYYLIDYRYFVIHNKFKCFYII